MNIRCISFIFLLLLSCFQLVVASEETQTNPLLTASTRAELSNRQASLVGSSIGGLGAAGISLLSMQSDAGGYEARYLECNDNAFGIFLSDTGPDDLIAHFIGFTEYYKNNSQKFEKKKIAVEIRLKRLLKRLSGIVTGVYVPLTKLNELLAIVPLFAQTLEEDGFAIESSDQLKEFTGSIEDKTRSLGKGDQKALVQKIKEQKKSTIPDQFKVAANATRNNENTDGMFNSMDWGDGIHRTSQVSAVPVNGHQANGNSGKEHQAPTAVVSTTLENKTTLPQVGLVAAFRNLAWNPFGGRAAAIPAASATSSNVVPQSPLPGDIRADLSDDNLSTVSGGQSDLDMSFDAPQTVFSVGGAVLKGSQSTSVLAANVPGLLRLPAATAVVRTAAGAATSYMPFSSEPEKISATGDQPVNAAKIAAGSSASNGSLSTAQSAASPVTGPAATVAANGHSKTKNGGANGSGKLTAQWPPAAVADAAKKSSNSPSTSVASTAASKSAAATPAKVNPRAGQKLPPTPERSGLALKVKSTLELANGLTENNGGNIGSPSTASTTPASSASRGDATLTQRSDGLYVDAAASPSYQQSGKPAQMGGIRADGSLSDISPIARRGNNDISRDLDYDDNAHYLDLMDDASQLTTPAQMVRARVPASKDKENSYDGDAFTGGSSEGGEVKASNANDGDESDDNGVLVSVFQGPNAYKVTKKAAAKPAVSAAFLNAHPESVGNASNNGKVDDDEIISDSDGHDKGTVLGGNVANLSYDEQGPTMRSSVVVPDKRQPIQDILSDRDDDDGSHSVGNVFEAAPKDDSQQITTSIPLLTGGTTSSVASLGAQPKSESSSQRGVVPGGNVANLGYIDQGPTMSSSVVVPDKREPIKDIISDRIDDDGSDADGNASGSEVRGNASDSLSNKPVDDRVLANLPDANDENAHVGSLPGLGGQDAEDLGNYRSDGSVNGDELVSFEKSDEDGGDESEDDAMDDSNSLANMPRVCGDLRAANDENVSVASLPRLARQAAGGSGTDGSASDDGSSSDDDAMDASNSDQVNGHVRPLGERPENRSERDDAGVGSSGRASHYSSAESSVFSSGKDSRIHGKTRGNRVGNKHQKPKKRKHVPDDLYNPKKPKPGITIFKPLLGLAAVGTVALLYKHYYVDAKSFRNKADLTAAV